ncbi:hypothetical protein GCM10009734_57640 [Nonomuraea bangladeshensis]
MRPFSTVMVGVAARAGSAVTVVVARVAATATRAGRKDDTHDLQRSIRDKTQSLRQPVTVTRFDSRRSGPDARRAYGLG